MDDRINTPDPLPKNRPQGWTIRTAPVEDLQPMFDKLELKLPKGSMVAAQVFYDPRGKRRKLQARYANNALVSLKFVPGKAGFIDIEISERIDFRFSTAPDAIGQAA